MIFSGVNSSVIQLMVEPLCSYICLCTSVEHGLKQGDALSPFIFNFALEYAIRRVQVNQAGFKLNGTYQLLVYAVDNTLGGSTYTIKKNAETLVVASKETGLEVNSDKTKYMIMSQDQNAGQRSCYIKTDNSSFERVEDFKYLGTTLTNQNSIQEDIKSKLKPGNACYHSAQNLLSSSLLSKNIKIKIIQNCNLACCFLWVQNLVTHIDVG